MTDGSLPDEEERQVLLSQAISATQRRLGGRDSSGLMVAAAINNNLFSVWRIASE